VKDFNPGELNELYETIALGALKFFLLRVDPKKKMVFNPKTVLTSMVSPALLSSSFMQG
jgi:arginyl-tRNA synthetase